MPSHEELIRDASEGDPGEENEAQYLPECPQCNGYGVYQGILGYQRYFLCRSCGWQFSIEIK